LWPEANPHGIHKDKEVKVLIVTSYQRYDAAYNTMQQLKDVLERGTNSNGTFAPDSDKATVAAFIKQVAQKCLRIRDDILCPDHTKVIIHRMVGRHTKVTGSAWVQAPAGRQPETNVSTGV
jgi:hypothetical protein